MTHRPKQLEAEPVSQFGSHDLRRRTPCIPELRVVAAAVAVAGHGQGGELGLEWRSNRQRNRMQAGVLGKMRGIPLVVSVVASTIALAGPPASASPRLVPAEDGMAAYRRLRDAPQVIWRDGVPHLDRSGRVRVA